jgi:hypothetical protein
MKNRVLYIDYLDHLSFFFGLLAQFFFKKVYFHNAIPTFQSEKALKILSNIGLHWISFKGVPFEIYCKAFHLDLELSDLVQKKYIGRINNFFLFYEPF